MGQLQHSSSCYSGIRLLKNPSVERNRYHKNSQAAWPLDHSTFTRTPALSSLLPGVVHRQISPVLRVMSTVTASAKAEAISMIATTTRTLRLSHRQIQRRQYVRACGQSKHLGCARHYHSRRWAGGVSCSSAVKSFLARYIPARIFSATLTMAEESTSEEKVVSRKVCLHRVEVPVAIKDAAILAADAAMDKYSTEKVRFTLSKGKFALRVPSP